MADPESGCKSAKLIFSVSFFIFILFFSIFYAQKLTKIPFHSDEMLWPCMGDIYRQWIKGDWRSTQWTISKYHFANPPLSKYMFGWWINMQQQQNKDLQLFQEGCYHSWPLYVGKTFADLNNTELKFILSVRKINIVVSVMTLLVIFLLTANLFGSIPAIVSTFLIGTHPLFVAYAVRAMAEMTMLLFISLSLFFLVFFIRKLFRKRYGYVYAILYGVTCGFSFMSKPYGIIALSPFLVMMPFIPFKVSQKIKLAGLVSLSILITVYLIYPPFLMNPFSVIRWFQEWFGIQHEFNIIFPRDALNNPPERLNEILHFFSQPEKIAGIINSGWINLLSAAVFGILLIRTILTGRKIGIGQLFILSTFCGFVFTGLFYLYRDWDRYFLPYLFIFALLYGFIIKEGLCGIRNLIRRI